jgi:hypothetical protein
MNTKIGDRLLAGPAVLRPRDLEHLLAAPDARRWRGRRDRALLAAMALGGLRVGEAVKLSRDNVETDGRRMRLTFTGKGGRRRTVSLAPDAAKALRAWLADPRCGRWWVFPGRRGEHLGVRAAQLIVDGYAREALGRRLHPHTLRHSMASALMRKSSDLRLVQMTLGHRNPKTTADYYLAWATSDADRAADLLGEVMHPAGGQPLTDPRPLRGAWVFRQRATSARTFFLKQSRQRRPARRRSFGSSSISGPPHSRQDGASFFGGIGAGGGRGRERRTARSWRATGGALGLGLGRGGGAPRAPCSLSLCCTTCTAPGAVDRSASRAS